MTIILKSKQRKAASWWPGVDTSEQVPLYPQLTLCIWQICSGFLQICSVDVEQRKPENGEWECKNEN